MTDLEKYIEYLENKYETKRKSRKVVCGKEGIARQLLVHHNSKIAIEMKSLKSKILSAKLFLEISKEGAERIISLNELSTIDQEFDLGYNKGE